MTEFEYKTIVIDSKETEDSKKSHIAGLLAANFIIFLLSFFTSSLLTANHDI